MVVAGKRGGGPGRFEHGGWYITCRILWERQRNEPKEKKRKRKKEKEKKKTPMMSEWKINYLVEDDRPKRGQIGSLGKNGAFLGKKAKLLGIGPISTQSLGIGRNGPLPVSGHISL